MNLQLSLKHKWFEMTNAGVKTEDYREINANNCCRYVLVSGEKKTTKWWQTGMTLFQNDDVSFPITMRYDYSFINFEYNIMTLGYPSSEDFERILKLEHKGIEIRTGNPEWGAEPNKLYFVIKHGKIN